MELKTAGPHFHRVPFFPGEKVLAIPVEVFAHELKFKTCVGDPYDKPVVIVQVVAFPHLLHEVEKLRPAAAHDNKSLGAAA